MCIFLLQVGHCGKWDWCTVGFVQEVYSLSHRLSHGVYLWSSVLIITEGVLEAVSILVTLNSKKLKAPVSCFRKKCWCFRHFVLHEKPYLFFVPPSIGTRAPFLSYDRLISALGFTILVRWHHYIGNPPRQHGWSVSSMLSLISFRKCKAMVFTFKWFQIWPCTFVSTTAYWCRCAPKEYSITGMYQFYINIWLLRPRSAFFKMKRVSPPDGLYLAHTRFYLAMTTLYLVKTK